MDNFNAANTLGNIIIRTGTSTSDLSLGDQLFVQYTYHGVYIGNKEVVHYLTNKGVTIYSLDNFARSAKIPKTYSSTEVLVRARIRLGEMEYNLAMNNCENFVHWSRSGR